MFLKIIFCLLWIAFALTSEAVAGLHFGVTKAIKAKVQELKDKKAAQAQQNGQSSVSSNNHAPTLAWLGFGNYASDGLNPETGDTSTSYIFYAKYTDADGDAPASGYPRLRIKKGGADISGSPFTMIKLSGGYSVGTIYMYSLSLAQGTDYAYYFEATDVYGTAATGTPTVAVSGPAVSGTVGPGWQVTTVDTDWPAAPSIAIDLTSGKPRIAYYSVPNGTALRYAQWTGTVWSTQTIKNSTGSFQIELALTAADVPHIVFHNNDVLKYTKLVASVWQEQTIDSLSEGYPSFRLDSSVAGRVAYNGANGLSRPGVDNADSHLKYAQWSGSWSTTTLNFGELYPMDWDPQMHYPSMDLDSQDRPRLAYSYKGIRYTEWNGAWIKGELVAGSSSNMPNDMVIDINDDPHIVFLNPGDGIIKYAKKSGSSWSIEEVGVIKENYAYIPSLAVDLAGNPHIVYDSPDNGLMYAKKTVAGWDIQTITTATSSTMPSLALDSAGTPHVAYIKGSRLYHAEK